MEKKFLKKESKLNSQFMIQITTLHKSINPCIFKQIKDDKQEQCTYKYKGQ